MLSFMAVLSERACSSRLALLVLTCAFSHAGGASWLCQRATSQFCGPPCRPRLVDTSCLGLQRFIRPMAEMCCAGHGEGVGYVWRGRLRVAGRGACCGMRYACVPGDARASPPCVVSVTMQAGSRLRA